MLTAECDIMFDFISVRFGALQHYRYFFPNVSAVQQKSQHMTCNLTGNYLLFNSSKSSFVSVCILIFSIAVPNKYTPV